MPGPSPVELTRVIYPTLELFKRLGLKTPDTSSTIPLDSSITDDRANRIQKDTWSPLQKSSMGFLQGLTGSSVLDNPNEDINNSTGYGKATGQLLPLLIGMGNMNNEDFVDPFGYADKHLHPDAITSSEPKLSKMNYGAIKTTPSAMSNITPNTTSVQTPQRSLADYMTQSNRQDVLNKLQEAFKMMNAPWNPNANDPRANLGLMKSALQEMYGSMPTASMHEISAPNESNIMDLVNELKKKQGINTAPSQLVGVK